jgi:uncharacterized protein (DUF488 family)
MRLFRHGGMTSTVYTIGHCNHTAERFLELLRGAGIAVVADVRSVPYSRRWPQFRRETLRGSLGAAGIPYVFLGRELGARPDDPACRREGRADYGLIAATEAFRDGLRRVEEGARRHRIALMCAEREPLDCHRTVLVARHLQARGSRILHILADGAIEAHEQTERRMLRGAGLGLLAEGAPERRLIEEAYEVLGRRLAWRGGG